jgi:hypothetical protein
MLYVILSGIWFAFTLCVGATMWATQVGPKEAVSNLSEWAVKFGIENPPEWLKAKSVDRVVRRRAAIILGILLLVGGFIGGMAFDDYLHSRLPRPQSQHQANRWEPLSTQETLALQEIWRGLPPNQLHVLCAIPACADLAQSVYDAAKGLDWPAVYEGSYFTDENGIHAGIEIWSYREQSEMRDKIANAMERATSGRLQISSHEYPNYTPPPSIAKQINLVIGRLR